MTIRQTYFAAFIAFILTTLLFTPVPTAAQEAQETGETAEEADSEYVVLDDVIAWVGSQYITQSEYDFEKMRQRTMLEQSEMTAEQRQNLLDNFDRRVFDSLVERLLVLQAGEDAGLRVPGSEVEAFIADFGRRRAGSSAAGGVGEALRGYGACAEWS